MLGGSRFAGSFVTSCRHFVNCATRTPVGGAIAMLPRQPMNMGVPKHCKDLNPPKASRFPPTASLAWGYWTGYSDLGTARRKEILVSYLKTFPMLILKAQSKARHMISLLLVIEAGYELRTYLGMWLLHP